jgi:CheY-like chemotaxis protein
MAKILIAGSDQAALDVLSAEIAGEGHEVIAATDGREAHQLALYEAVDAVFLEVTMPVASGLETCMLLRGDPDIAPQLPVFLLSPPETDVRVWRKAGATGTFPKQHSSSQVRDLLAKHLSAQPTVQ